MKIETHPQHDRQWTTFTFHQQNYTLGHLLLPYLQRSLPFAACNMKHPLECGEMEMLLHAAPEQARLALQSACQAAHADLDRSWSALQQTFSCS